MLLQVGVSPIGRGPPGVVPGARDGATGAVTLAASSVAGGPLGAAAWGAAPTEANTERQRIPIVARTRRPRRCPFRDGRTPAGTMPGTISWRDATAGALPRAAATTPGGETRSTSAGSI